MQPLQNPLLCSSPFKQLRLLLVKIGKSLPAAWREERLSERREVTIMAVLPDSESMAGVHFNF
jgi:hypothetical protein